MCHSTITQDLPYRKTFKKQGPKTMTIVLWNACKTSFVTISCSYARLNRMVRSQTEKTVNWLRITMKTFWDANMIPCVPHYRHVNSFFKRKINEFCFFFLFQFFLLRLFRQRAYHKQHSEHFDLAQCNLQIQTCTKRQIELDRRSRDTGNK